MRDYVQESENAVQAGKLLPESEYDTAFQRRNKVRVVLRHDPHESKIGKIVGFFTASSFLAAVNYIVQFPDGTQDFYYQACLERVFPVSRKKPKRMPNNDAVMAREQHEAKARVKKKRADRKEAATGKKPYVGLRSRYGKRKKT